MSIKIDPKIERDLTELAALKNMSVNALVREFTADQKRYYLSELLLRNICSELASRRGVS